ncbi:MAG TPA: L,D-transpeptidase [Thermoanaerobaculia bacterium]|jgi:L,D-transpeptidase YbiS|nr:L,D-transpeptidase [Thermoanaerobaculia bacterium]
MSGLFSPADPAQPTNPTSPPYPYGAGAARVRFRFPWQALLLALGGIVLAVLAAGLVGGFSYREIAAVPLPHAPAVRHGESARLALQIAGQEPRGTYIAVDTVANRLYLLRDGEVVREAVCSTGTGGVLEDPTTGRRWVFETPRGTHRVQQKIKSPVWNKPDWAFVEDGVPIPRNPAERRDTYSLGDYALDLGDGYLIHGTLYQRLLGRSVTHGCVRLGDADLEAVYKAAAIGTRVYIY